MSNNFKGCLTPGCDHWQKRRGYCDICYYRLQSINYGAHGNLPPDAAPRGPANRLPEEVAREFLRRVRRFENPGKVARDLGWSLQTLNKGARRLTQKDGAA